MGLDGCFAKLDRADEQIISLGEENRAFVEDRRLFEPLPIQQERDWHVGRVRVLERPTLRWGVVLGEIVHNLTSCLDHLVWQLVLRNGETPTQRNQFPTCDTEETWEDQLRRHRLDGVARDDVDTIRAAEPFTRSDDKGQHLSLLRDLSSIDKHRVVLPGLAVLIEDKPMEAQVELDPPTSTLMEVRYSPAPLDQEVVEVVRLRVRATQGVSTPVES
jgi:hypothetical protein